MACKSYQPLVTNAGFLLVISSQAVAATFSIVVSVFAVTKFIKSHFHINCKILIISLLILYFLHSMFVASLQVLQVTRYLLYADACEAAFSSRLCFGLRLPASSCATSFALLQLGVITERTVALWRRKHYEETGATLGIAIAGCCVSWQQVTAGAAFSIWSFSPMILETQTVYCSISTAETANRIKIRSYFCCAINSVALGMAVLVFFLNAVAIRRKRFDLQSSYQLQENLDVIRIIIPLSVFQTLCLLSLSISAAVLLTFESSIPMVTFRTLMAGAYILPYYTFASPLILIFLLRWSSHKRTTKLAALGKTQNNEAYFEGYSKMWEVNVPDKVNI